MTTCWFSSISYLLLCLVSKITDHRSEKHGCFKYHEMGIPRLFKRYNPNPTVVDDWQERFGVCNGKVVRGLDARVARMTRPSDTQKKETVCLQDKRKAVGFRQQRGEPSQGDQKILGLEQSRSPPTLGSGATAQTFFKYSFFPIGSQNC